LTLKLRERVEKLVVYPALTGADYDKALKSYESKFADYKNLVIKKEADEKRLKEEFEAKQATYLAEQKRLGEEYIKEKIRWQREQQSQLNNAMQDFTSQAIVTRVFSLSNFGVFNSDCPNSLPKGASINPIYVTNEKSIIPNTIYLICHNKNLVYNLQYGTLKFNPKDAYSLCIISNGKMYLCNKETFTAIASSKENKIPLIELSNEVNDAIDLRKAIGI
jgi:predicted HicB family RNase H-like nuclease